MPCTICSSTPDASPLASYIARSRRICTSVMTALMRHRDDRDDENGERQDAAVEEQQAKAEHQRHHRQQRLRRDRGDDLLDGVHAVHP